MYNLYKSKSSKAKFADLHYISDSKLCQKVIVLKVKGKILHIYSLVMLKFLKLDAPM